MSYLASTNRQVPDHSIMDFFNKQIYLGNQYSVSQNFTVGSSETALMLLINSQTGSPQNIKSLFQNLLTLRENTASHTCLLNVYLNPTVSAYTVQVVTTRADSSGNLNSTYWTFYMPGNIGYYVWYNINSAGVDPAPAGLTGIEVSAATGAIDSVIATDTKNAINTAAVGTTATSSATTVTLTNTIAGPVTPAADSSAAATSFTFSVSAGQGIQLTPINLRPSYGNNSLALVTQTPVASANGTLVDSFSSAALSTGQSSLLKILDVNQSLLITSVASASSTSINVILNYYEL